MNNQMSSSWSNSSLYAKINVVSKNSDYFAAMFTSNIRESIERVVKLPECSKAASLQVLMIYLYIDGFIVSIDDVVNVWVLADMYQLEGLKLCCKASLQRDLCERHEVA